MNLVEDDVPSIPASLTELENLLLGWIKVRISEGLTVLQKEPTWADIQKAMDYINGKQMPLRSKAISKTHNNKLKKITLETISSLTDVRPIWNYDTHNEQYKPQGEILNKLARGWWKNNAVDRALQSTLAYSMAGGAGYAALYWDETKPGGGDFTLLPVDTRDVIPIQPVFSDSIQDWGGVVIRQRLPVEAVKEMYPDKAHRITGQGGSWFGAGSGTSGTSTLGSLISGVWSVLTRSTDERGLIGGKTVDLMRVWYKDPAINTTGASIQVGDPDTNYSYTVPPLGRLYPRGRLIVCTPEAILSDGPNPYWHGMLPIIRFILDPLPWTLNGSSIIQDLIPLQDALNEGLRGLEDGMGQWIRRGVVADRSAVSRATLDTIDTRKSGLQVMVNPSAGEGFKVVDGPEFPQWYLEYVGLLKTELDENSGVRGLQNLTQLKQMPSSESMEKYMDALSPLLRLRARSIEISLGELAEMLKVGFFQYYDMERRMQILGPDGQALEDFDYDPDSLVPEALDENGQMIPREVRAQKHHKNFTFSIAPNSFLNVSHMTQKMLNLQLLRANLLDPWTALDSFDVANVGEAPAETVIDRIIEAKRMGLIMGPPPEVVQAQNMMMLAQAQMALGQMAAMQNVMPGAGAPPGGGPPPPGGPNTSGVGPQGGRPPSGQNPPQMIQKPDGRTVVSESGGGGEG